MTNIPWPDMECIYFTDGSSFIQNGIIYAGAVVVGLDSVIQAAALLPETSTQKAELKALTQALKLAKGATANIYIDSRYA